MRTRVYVKIRAQMSIGPLLIVGKVRRFVCSYWRVNNKPDGVKVWFWWSRVFPASTKPRVPSPAQYKQSSKDCCGSWYTYMSLVHVFPLLPVLHWILPRNVITDSLKISFLQKWLCFWFYPLVPWRLMLYRTLCLFAVSTVCPPSLTACMSWFCPYSSLLE